MLVRVLKFISKQVRSKKDGKGKMSMRKLKRRNHVERRGVE
jgi:hypothetical protein